MAARMACSIGFCTFDVITRRKRKKPVRGNPEPPTGVATPPAAKIIPYVVGCAGTLSASEAIASTLASIWSSNAWSSGVIAPGLF